MATHNELPWIIFELKGQNYAINTRLVTGIIQLPEITFVPEAPEVFSGVSNVRGDVIPILDLRKLLRMQSSHDEQESIIETLTQRKQDHLNWITALRESIESNTHFSLATDPHRCAFGVWFDSYKAENTSTMHILEQIAEPHRLLHENATKAIEAAANYGAASEECAKILKQIELVYCPKVIAGLDSLIENIRATYAPMVITLSHTDGEQIPCMGFIVDNVRAVDKLELISENEKNNHCLFMSQHACGIAHNEKIPGEIIIINENTLLELISDFNDRVIQ